MVDSRLLACACGLVCAAAVFLGSWGVVVAAVALTTAVMRFPGHMVFFLMGWLLPLHLWLVGLARFVPWWMVVVMVGVYWFIVMVGYWVAFLPRWRAWWPLIWVAWEWGWSQTFIGHSAYAMGHLINAVPVWGSWSIYGGIYGQSLVFYGGVWWIMWLLRQPSFWIRCHALWAVCGMVALVSWGHVVWLGHKPGYTTALSILPVSTAVDQRLKLDPVAWPRVRAGYARRLAQLDPAVDVALMPETLVPTWLDEAGLRATVQQAVSPWVVMGAPIYEASAGYNAVVAVHNGQVVRPIYKKQRLMPFGEYTPGRSWLPWLVWRDDRSYSRGPADQQPLRLGETTMGMLICLESLYCVDMARWSGRADWVGVTANLAWFDSILAPRLYRRVNRARALEGHRWVVVSTNGGGGYAVDPYGWVRSERPVSPQGYAWVTPFHALIQALMDF